MELSWTIIMSNQFAHQQEDLLCLEDIRYTQVGKIYDYKRWSVINPGTHLIFTRQMGQIGSCILLQKGKRELIFGEFAEKIIAAILHQKLTSNFRVIINQC